ncbi:uncharacterized protein C8Q71DRAFT_788043 [Rhodofomes roseus]|uniref:Secreted protein n=1 Tax=Rhodofomes roseus TaxID=34475 RepID=A0ABQ8K0H9_9APHY|nr:uncharacterized protein C8Q71DRAFT_788043 [Rhodofomes roseus]KAH9829957.1 hypothetical protein C8Q71DRAFT_788043 [Rhodofomes roseus]
MFELFLQFPLVLMAGFGSPFWCGLCHSGPRVRPTSKPQARPAGATLPLIHRTPSSYPSKYHHSPAGASLPALRLPTGRFLPV